MPQLRKETEEKFDKEFPASFIRYPNAGENIQDQEYIELNSFAVTRTKLKAFIAEIEAEAEQRGRKAKDQAYWERNQLVSALSRIYPAWLGLHSADDKDWEKDWRNIVFIKIPIKKKVVSGDEHNHVPESEWFKTIHLQLSWHIHDDDTKYFTHLDPGLEEWDGHTTEEKYQRLAMLKTL